jgi:hypothetical protein
MISVYAERPAQSVDEFSVNSELESSRHWPFPCGLQTSAAPTSGEAILVGGFSGALDGRFCVIAEKLNNPHSDTGTKSQSRSQQRDRFQVVFDKREANVKTFRLGATMESEATQPARNHRAWRSFPGLTMTSGLGQLRRRRSAAVYQRPLSTGIT